LHAGPQELETSKQLFSLTILTIPQETTHTICDAGMNLNKWAILRVMLEDTSRPSSTGWYWRSWLEALQYLDPGNAWKLRNQWQKYLHFGIKQPCLYSNLYNVAALTVLASEYV